MSSEKQSALDVINVLHENGYQAMFAGGCVRDELLGREPKDYDVATDALPSDVCKLFRRTIEVGAQFGVIVVMIKDDPIEVATFRTESGYIDGRRPDKVEFSNAKEDASRRDFTVNGMFYDPIKGEVIDYVGGQEDLGRKVLRTIGEPDERFGEDYLRMLRAVRFGAQLGFEIEDETWGAVIKNAPKIEDISGERVSMELMGMLTILNRRVGLRLLLESGLCGYIFSGVDGDVFENGEKVFGQIEGERISYTLALAAVFAFAETKQAMGAMDVLKLSRNQIRSVEWLLSRRDVLLDMDMELADLKMLAVNEDYGDLFKLQMGIQQASGFGVEALEFFAVRLKKLDGVDLKPAVLLNGNELIELGVRPGPDVGKAMSCVYRAQLNEKIHTKEEAAELVLAFLG